MDEEKITRLNRLELDIDLRLRELWIEAAEVTEWDITQVAAFFRAAYGVGYMDALREDTKDQRAKLCKDNGYSTI